MRSALRDEVRRLAADERDREEMHILQEQLAEIALPLSGSARVGAKRRVHVRPLRYTGWMADDVRELLVTELALEKLGARGISAIEAEQVPRNQHVTVRDPHEGSQGSGRRLLIGRTDGGRVLTLVVEQTADPTTWLIVTGWGATETERKILERR